MGSPRRIAVAVLITLAGGCRSQPAPAPTPVAIAQPHTIQPTTQSARPQTLEPRTEEGKPVVAQEQQLPRGGGYGFLGLIYEPDTRPLVVRYVVPGSGADDAGVKPGDKILRLDSIKLPDSQQVKNFVRQNPPGSYATLVVDRNGSRIEFRVRLIDPIELHDRLNRDPNRPPESTSP